MSSETNDHNTITQHPHFLIVPLFEQGHMIPMLDLARLLADNRSLVTFITTPVNLARISQPTISSPSLRFIPLQFPVASVGLPEGCENADLVPSADHLLTFVRASSLLRDPLEAHLRAPDQWPKPSCLISDNIQHWTAGIARSLGIPRLIFHGPSCMYLYCRLLIDQHKAELEAACDAASGAPVILPNLPHPIRANKQDITSAWHSQPGFSDYVETIQLAQKCADGVIVNSFAELEPLYYEKYREATGKRVWPIGPVSLYKEALDAKAARGRVSSIDNGRLYNWLDGQKPGSVVLVSFGSFARNTEAQLVELGHGLEASGRAFVWVVKEVGMGEWMDGFEDRVKGRGIVIRGWAPQAVILGHVAVGGFVTHCGWNSVLEAIATGVVMATWPHFGDQFLNEQLVVEVLEIGVAVGVDKPTLFGMEDGDERKVKVRRGEVEKVVGMLMGGGEEGEGRRKRARELKEKARMAMEEGGSSWKGLQDVIIFARESMKMKSKD